MKALYERFITILEKAILDIENTYIKFEAVGLFDGFMERTYTYELYHQLRTCQQNEHINDFVIHAEPEKRRTFFFKEILSRIEIEKLEFELDEDFQKRVMPDLLVHIPNDPDGNIAIVEVKPEKGHINTEGFSKDIKVLKQFVTGSKEAKGYFKGIELLYKTAAGFSSEDEIRDEYAPILKEALGEGWEQFVDSLLLMWHPGVNQKLINISWH